MEEHFHVGVNPRCLAFAFGFPRVIDIGEDGLGCSITRERICAYLFVSSTMNSAVVGDRFNTRDLLCSCLVASTLTAVMEH